jgi:hypothetical protein
MFSDREQGSKWDPSKIVQTKKKKGTTGGQNLKRQLKGGLEFWNGPISSLSPSLLHLLCSRPDFQRRLVEAANVERRVVNREDGIFCPTICPKEILKS